MRLTPEQWLQLYCILQRFYHGNNPNVQRMLKEVESRSSAEAITGLSGLRQTVNELMTLHSPFLEFEREKLNLELQRSGLPPLHVLEARRKTSFRRLLQRGTIKSEEEYYLVRGLVEDAEPSISADDHAALMRLLAAHHRSL